ncbi:HAD family hydrolase [Candidatus Woesearchaeota archaeon]|jgi:putative hydrolase of the HAD superfamily|nr:HAD family hydrolase [Candidatus Woesearchaeota archaeon]
MLIIFDLDDTLIDSWNTSIPIKLKIALQEMIKAGLKVKDEEIAFQRILELNESTDNGKTALQTFLHELNNTDEKLLEIGHHAYYGGPVVDIIRPPLPGAIEVLQILHKNHTLSIVTHGEEETQNDKITRSKIDTSLFKKIIITPKYDKLNSYKQILEELHFSPENSVVIGDKYKTDLIPAKTLGMKTVHMKWGKGKIIIPEENEVDYIISDLHVIPKIVEELCKP